jgi:hypothetical protein
MKLGGERLGAQESVKVFAMCIECSTELERRGGPFIAPLRESSRWGVRNPDMSGSGVGHVRSTSLETGLEIGYV